MARLSGTSRTSCTTCEVVHVDVATILGPMAPDAWGKAEAGERLEAELTPDVCILPCGGLVRYFVRGHLQLPLTDNTRDIGETPLLMLSPGCDHELAAEQRDGIDLHRAAEFACLLHH